jgi:hypothetical protein
VTLRFDRGTLVLEGPVDALADRLEAAGMTFDLRIARWRAPAASYRDLFAALHRAQEQGLLQLDDQARAYGALDLRFAAERTPRFYQSEALAAWNRAGRRGLVVLPTGAGKSLVAHLAIAAAARDTLIVVPTIDLMLQWHDGLRSDFGLAKANKTAVTRGIGTPAYMVKCCPTRVERRPACPCRRRATGFST